MLSFVFRSLFAIQISRFLFMGFGFKLPIMNGFICELWSVQPVKDLRGRSDEIPNDHHSGRLRRYGHASAADARSRRRLSIHRTNHAVSRSKLIVDAGAHKFGGAGPLFENADYAADPNERPAGPNAARRRISVRSIDSRQRCALGRL